jgi:hypothetical protein
VSRDAIGADAPVASASVFGRGVLALVAVSLLAGGCGDGDGPQRSGDAGPASPRLDLPPNDRERLAELFDPQLAPLGLRLTRGTLIDAEGGYRPSNTGRHLAMYVEPTGPYTPAQYAQGIVPSARVFLPAVFERWDQLETFDICQEPVPGTDDRAEPPPVTQLYVTRKEALDIDWGAVRLADLLARGQPPRPEYKLYVAPSVSDDPSYPSISQA